MRGSTLSRRLLDGNRASWRVPFNENGVFSAHGDGIIGHRLAGRFGAGSEARRARNGARCRECCEAHRAPLTC